MGGGASWVAGRIAGTVFGAAWGGPVGFAIGVVIGIGYTVATSSGGGGRTRITNDEPVATKKT